MRKWPNISQEDLEHWADSPESRTEFPRLVRKLITETGKGVSFIRMASGSGVATGGFDGVVEAETKTAFVPSGKSVWELSVGDDLKRKADSDYQKRTEKPIEGVLLAETTYVQVILRRWGAREDWASERRGEGKWRDVIALGIDDLQEWLDQAPAASAWLAEVIGIPTEGVTTASSWWKGWLNSTTFRISADVVLGGREGQARKLLDRIHSGSGTSVIGGDVRIDEIRAFLSAAVESVEGDGSGEQEILFVAEPKTFHKLLRRHEPLCLFIPDPAYLKNISNTGNHHVLIAVPGDRRDNGHRVVLPSIDEQRVTEILESQGQPEEKAREWGFLARRSLLALQRHLAHEPHVYRPSWATEAIPPLRRALLLHSWNRTAAKDREVVAELIGCRYSEIEEEFTARAHEQEDPLLALTDGMWHVVSPLDAWELLGPHLSENDLLDFRGAVMTVLGECDPALDIPIEDRWKANLHGASRSCSVDLGDGLARSLALLGTTNPRFSGPSGTGEAWAGRIVGRLLDRANADSSFGLWTSLSRWLPLLAEAAPGEFIEALRTLLSSSGPPVDGIFTDRGRGPIGVPHPSPHTHLQTALVNLAWSPNHFADAVGLLARLAELDPGGGWANRPQQSLDVLFCPWYPNTSVPADQRHRVLRRVMRKFPDVTWQLLLSGLPDPGAMFTSPPNPVYRDWKRGEPRISRSEYAESVNTLFSMALENTEGDPRRYGELIDKAPNLSLGHRKILGERLVAFAESASEAERYVPWDKLRGLIAHHREYADTAWALPEEELSPLERVEEALRPTQPELLHNWLFRDNLVTLGDLRRRDDFAAYDAETSARRRAAVVDIHAHGGLDTVLAFAEKAPYPQMVGFALGSTDSLADDRKLLPLLAGETGVRTQIAEGYFGARFRSEGWDWVDELISEQTPSALVIARLFASTQDQVEAIRRAESSDGEISTAYWKEFVPYGLGGDFPLALLAARRLAETGRRAAALDLLALYQKSEEISIERVALIADVFQELMNEEGEDREQHLLRERGVKKLIAELRQQADVVGAERIASIEWFFLSALGHRVDAEMLHRSLNENPAFFTQVVEWASFPATLEESEHDRSEPRQRVAMNAYRLLQSWRLVPALDEYGALQPERLFSWVNEARGLLREADRAEVGDSMIGQALAHAPADPDGTWPCVAVRELLEEVESEALERGLSIGIFNKDHEVAFRDPRAGGERERERAEPYRRWAGQASVEWPRTARVLRGLVDQYESHARLEDDKAERFRRGLG